MPDNKSNAFWLGLLMVIAGAIWFLDAANVLQLGEIWVAALFAVGGLVFAVVWARWREHWWAAIPAGALLGIAGVIAWEELLPAAADEWGAALFLGALGIGFLAIYARTHERWWAIIPGGVLVSLALLVGATTVLPEMQATAVLFAGLAVTFTLLAIVPVDGKPMRWPLIPVIPLAVLALAFGAGAAGALELFEYVWPVALILGGVYLVWRVVNPTRPHGTGR